MSRYPTFRPGQPIGLRDRQGRILINRQLADALTDAGRELERLGRVSATPPLLWNETTTGRVLSHSLPPWIMAKLSGSGPNYSFVQQQYDPATNTWSDMVGGRSGTNCYESKGKTGLAGKVVRLDWVSTAADWRFQAVCTDCGCVADVNHICICDCPIPLPRTATTGDDLGTHVLTNVGASIVWQGTHNIATTIYRNSGGVCVTDGSLWQIFYRLSYVCPGTPSVPAGRWTLSVEARIVVCFGFANPGSPSTGGGSFWTAADSTDFTCDPDAVLEFDIPDVFTSPSFPGITYPNPGGGGPMTVTLG